jgi:hypothetical protein
MTQFRFSVAILLAAAAAGGPLWGQSQPDPMQPRPPLLLEASRTERAEAMLRMHLQEFLGAIQRADTVALSSLIPADAIPGAEKPVASKAGCSSPGQAAARLKSAREGESVNPALPLSGVTVGNVMVTLGGQADTAARVAARIMERRAGRTRYAPFEMVFVETAGSWRLAIASGVLLGLCGMVIAG